MDKHLEPTKEQMLSRGFQYRNAKTQYPEFCDYLQQKYPGVSFGEQLYMHIHGLSCPPTCKCCGGPVSFRNRIYGYSEYCSAKCVSIATKQKRKETCLERYGKLGGINSEKFKQTCLKKYGVENPFQSETVKDKIKRSLLEKYGVEFAQQSEKIQQTKKENCLIKYGVDHPGKTIEVRKKISDALRSYEISSNLDIVGYDGEYQIRQCPNPNCNKCSEKVYITTGQIDSARKKYNIEPCTNILPIKENPSQPSHTMLFIREILKNHNIKFEEHENRKILEGQGIDIYIPDYKLGIECNGVYWHSDKIKHRQYHVDKYKKACDAGIRLIQVWDDQRIRHPRIVGSLILSKLGIYKEKIGARKCSVKQIDGRTANEFYNANHIQGQTRSSIHYGLYHTERLVACMSFSKRSKLSGGKNDDSWELTRFCSLLNTQVIGGAGKLLKYFINHYHPQKIISFSSNDISDGGLYKKLGFTTDGKVTGSYWYIDQKTHIRYHRTSFCKTRLAKLGYDVSKSESEIMNGLPYFRIYDSGHTKWELVIRYI